MHSKNFPPDMIMFAAKWIQQYHRKKQLMENDN